VPPAKKGVLQRGKGETGGEKRGRGFRGGSREGKSSTKNWGVFDSKKKPSAWGGLGTGVKRGPKKGKGPAQISPQEGLGTNFFRRGVTGEKKTTKGKTEKIQIGKKIAASFRGDASVPGGGRGKKVTGKEVRKKGCPGQGAREQKKKKTLRRDGPAHAKGKKDGRTG